MTTIDAHPPLIELRLPRGSGPDARQGEQTPFEQILAALGDDFAARPRDVAAIAPAIGSDARAFTEGSLLVLASVDLSRAIADGETGPLAALASEMAMVDGAGDTPAAEPARPAPSQLAQQPNMGEITRALGDWLDQLVDPAKGDAKAGLDNPGRGGAAGQSSFLATPGQAAVGAPTRANSQPAAIAPSLAQPVSSNAQAEPAGGDPAEPLQALPRAMTARAGHSSPFAALLTPHEGGLRLMVRAPNLSREDAQILRREIASIFSARGMPTPELHLRIQALSQTEGND